MGLPKRQGEASMNQSNKEMMSRLSCEAECRNLLLRAAWFVDHNEASRLTDVFAEDATLQNPSGSMVEGHAAIVDSYTEPSADRITRHLIIDSLFSEVLDDEAFAVTSVLLWAGSEEDEVGPSGRPARGKQILGRFDDTFTRTERGWRIKHRLISFELFQSFD